ncbi:uncharacterized protein LOC117791308 [Drosophila innubila]|uniref:uncharacterized protein LOC117791308 n=1 Tax=Drosophila innubila TaxID=198719 RepID=UPI00148C715F|nr:uncharacterized protein LOC117791308 [Drosophila innubila]
MLIKTWYLLGLLLLSLVFSFAEAAKYLTEKPDILIPCSLDDAGFNNCLGRNLQVMLTNWKDGVPGTKTVGPWEPFSIKRVKLSQNDNSALAINADLRNIVVRGASQAVVKETRYNQKQYKLRALLNIPKLSFDFDYKVRGNILVLNLNGQGKGQFEAGKITMVVELDVKPRITPEANFADLQHVKTNIPEIGSFKVKLNNLFGGDKQLEETAHTIINENWRQFVDILRPAIEQAIEAVMSDRFTKLLNYLPATYLIENFH